MHDEVNIGTDSEGGEPPVDTYPRGCMYGDLEGVDGDGANAYHQGAHLGRVVRPATTRSTGRAVPAARRTVQQDQFSLAQ
jgi:hypothetical protein